MLILLKVRVRFVRAVEYSLVPNALQEISAIRQLLQNYQLLNESYRSLLSNGYSFQSFLSNASLPFSCGLGVFGIVDCPWQEYHNYYATGIASASANNQNLSIGSADYPDIGIWFNESSSLSFLNASVGLPRWIGIAYVYSLISTTVLSSLVSATPTELDDILQGLIYETLVESNRSSTPDEAQLVATEAVVKATAMFLSDQWFNKFGTVTFELLRQEYLSTPVLVPCSPTGSLCIWQLGPVSPLKYNSSLIDNLISANAKSSGSLNNLYLPKNAARYFNVFRYCHSSVNASEKNCTNFNNTTADALINQPSLLWGEANGISIPDPQTLASMFLQLDSTTQSKYTTLACYIATSMFSTYIASSTFHTYYVVKFINANKESALSHVFSAENLTELAWAQFGTGAITQAVIGVRSTAQILHNGMWYMNEQFTSNMIELSSW